MKNFYKDKKIIVTGNTGFKGSWLTQILLSFGAEVVGISLPPPTSPNLFEALGLNKKIKTYYTDIRDFEKIKKIFEKEKPEIIFHLAAQPIVRNSYDDPLKTFSTNTLGTANILEAVRETKTVKSAVMITTDKVYENNESIYPYRETDRLGGYDPYSASKAAADIVVHSFIRSFFNTKDFGSKHSTLVAVARAGNVIGGGDWADHRLVPDVIRSVFHKKEKVKIRNPHAIRPWEHVMQPLYGYLMLGQGLYEGRTELSGAWNFGPDDESFVVVSELAKKAIKILGKGEVEIQPDTTKHEDVMLKLDINKAKVVLKWFPQFEFDETIQTTFDWYKKYYSKPEDIIEFTNKQIKNFFKNL